MLRVKVVARAGGRIGEIGVDQVLRRVIRILFHYGFRHASRRYADARSTG